MRKRSATPAHHLPPHPRREQDPSYPRLPRVSRRVRHPSHAPPPTRARDPLPRAKQVPPHPHEQVPPHPWRASPATPAASEFRHTRGERKIRHTRGERVPSYPRLPRVSRRDQHPSIVPASSTLPHPFPPYLRPLRHSCAGRNPGDRQRRYAPQHPAGPPKPPPRRRRTFSARRSRGLLRRFLPAQE